MAIVGFHASHEQFAPSELLALVQQAERAGFQAVTCSDHFHPWSREQGQSGYAWSWLGAAMALTRLPFGVVSSPVGRYHPAVAAQKAATLAEMFPGRFWMAAGSGEALNEAITGEAWPTKEARNQRLLEAVEVMRALWSGRQVDHDGAFKVRHAKLYTLPPRPSPLVLAALTPETARWGAAWADGLITVSMPKERLRAIAAAYRDAGGRGELHLQVKLSYARDARTASRDAWTQWRTNVLPPDVSENLGVPEEYEAAAASVSEADVRQAVHVSDDPGQHAAWLREYIALGFENLYLHNVNRDQGGFIADFGDAVLSRLR